MIMIKQTGEDHLPTNVRSRWADQKRVHWPAYLLFIAFLILGVVWFLFFSNFFSVSKYTINDLQVLERSAVVGEIEKFLKEKDIFIKDKKNIFLVNEQKLAEHIMNTFFVKSVVVDKVYPNILRLKITERQRSVLLITKNEIYVVDDYGVITDVADQQTADTAKNFLSSSVPIDQLKEIFVVTATSTIYEKGFEYTKSDEVRRWLDLSTKLREAGIWFKALYLDENNDGIVRIILKENKDVILDTKAPLDIQIETLRQFILSKPKWDEINEYIDVRIPGRIYYK